MEIGTRGRGTNGEEVSSRRNDGLTPPVPDDLVVAPWNRLAIEGLHESLRSPGERNPVLVYGPQGAGKTRLLDFYVDALRNRHPQWNVRSVTGKRFLANYQRSIYERKIQSFRNRYREADALIIDGIHTLQGKPACQREFLMTFDTLSSRKVPIVLGSRVKPRALTPFLPQLISRFMAGVIVPLRPLETLSRRALATEFARRHPLPLSGEVLTRIIETFEGTAAELDALVSRLVRFRKQTGRALPRWITTEAIDLASSGYGRPSLDRIASAVSNYFDLEPDEIRHERTVRRTTRARRIALYLACELTDHEHAEIGRAYGNRSRSTVRYARSEIRRLRETEVSVRQALSAIRHTLGVS